MEPTEETFQANTQLDQIQARLTKLSSEGESHEDPYQSKEKMNQARAFFEAMGLPFDDDGLISQGLTPEQIASLAKWREETKHGSIEMPDEETFFRKTLLAASLWRQTDSDKANYLFGKGHAAEVSIRGQIKGGVKRPAFFSYRSHSDFELYGVEYEHDKQGNNISGKSPYSDSFKAVFGGQEFFPPTKTKGLTDLPPDLLRETAETVELGGVEILVPELELQFLDKWEASGSYHRPEGTDAEVLARQYDLDRIKIHDYLDRFVIEPKREEVLTSTKYNPQLHFDRVTQSIIYARKELINSGVEEPSIDQVISKVNADMQQKIDIHGSNSDTRISGIRLKLWNELTPEQVGEEDRIVDEDLIAKIAEKMEEEKREIIARLHNKHSNLDDFFLEVDVDHALEERKLPVSIEGLPPVPEGSVRWIHTTNPNYVIPILQTGLDYEKYGMVDSTARPIDPNNPTTYFGTDRRFNYPTARTIIFDIPMSELRLHRDPTKAPGVLPSKYIVGVIDGYKPAPSSPEPKTIEQTPIQKASQKLIETLQNTPNYSGVDADLDGLIAAREELELTFSHFPELIPTFTSLYREELRKLGFDPGEIRAYMVGGRVRGTPLRESSDIDIIYAFENPMPPTFSKIETSGVDPFKWQAARRKLVFGDYVTLCAQFDIKKWGENPGRFQFLGWGDDSLREFELKEKDGEALLLYSNKPTPPSP